MASNSKFSQYLEKVISKIKEIPALIKQIPLLLKDTRKRWYIIAPAVLVVVLIASGLYYGLVYLPSHRTTGTALQTTVARRGDIILSASGTGTLQPASQVQLGFGSSGNLVTLNVKVGDQVKQGQVLAALDNTSPQIQYDQAVRSLANLTSPAAIATAQQDLATADAAVSTARDTLIYLISPNVYYWEQQVAGAQQALDDAKAAGGSSPTPDQQKAIDLAQAKLKYYQDSLIGSHAGYEKNYVPNHFTVLQKDLVTHTITKLVQAPTDAQIAGARAAYAGAQATAQEAQWYLDALNGKEIPDDATGANLNTFEQAKLDVQSAKAALDATQIVAPFSGTVMSVSAQQGDSVGTSAIITLGDMSKLYLQAYVDESDYQMFQVGNTANVVFDALPDRTFTGKVVEVDPALNTSSGSSVVSGLVELDNNSIGSTHLLMGMSASVDVIAGQAQNTVLVPLTALHEYTPGKYAVFVMRNNKLTVDFVEVGLKDLVNAQVTSGLQPGDVVSTGLAATRQQ